MKAFARNATTVILIAVAAPLPSVGSGAAARTVWDRAGKALAGVDGAPRASDVSMRCLIPHPRNEEDNLDTIRAGLSFHISRLDWSYRLNDEFCAKLKKFGIPYSGAVSIRPLVLEASDEEDRVNIRDHEGGLVHMPHMRTWKKKGFGCMNNPEYRATYLEYLKEVLDWGVLGLQRDGPQGQYMATRWGGCFCEHCMKAFRVYLRDNVDAGELKELGVENLDTFDYGAHLREIGAPAGDGFGRWDGGKLKELFIDFQFRTNVDFHKDMRKEINRIAGRVVPWSCNNGAHRFTEIESVFDFFIGELAWRRTSADRLIHVFQEAEDFGRLQMITMPKYQSTPPEKEIRRLTRRTIAQAYACGGLCLVPWDIYMPANLPRYFGEPSAYADLFAFIRANSLRLDGYGKVAAAGEGVTPRNDTEDDAPVRLRGGNGVYAVTRAIPGRNGSPVCVHLVDWSDKPESFEVVVNVARFGGRPLRYTLLTPVPYDAAAHRKASETGDYAPLGRSRPLAEGRVSTVEIPALSPWGILAIEPTETAEEGVWQPEVWAPLSDYRADALRVRMACASPGATIRYTLDGTEPTASSPRYERPVEVKDSVVVKARAFAASGGASPVASASFARAGTTGRALAPDAPALEGALRLRLSAMTLNKTHGEGEEVREWPAEPGPTLTFGPRALHSGQDSTPPTFEIDEDGRPLVRFDEETDHLAAPGFINEALAGKPFTIFMMSRSDDDLFGVTGNSLNGTGGDPRLYLTRRMYRYHELKKGIAPMTKAGELALNVYRFDGKGTISARANGEAAQPVSGLPLAEEFGSGGHLAIPFWARASFHPGDLLELIVYDRALTDEEIASVEAWLADLHDARWARRWR